MGLARGAVRSAFDPLALDRAGDFSLRRDRRQDRRVQLRGWHRAGRAEAAMFGSTAVFFGGDCGGGTAQRLRSSPAMISPPPGRRAARFAVNNRTALVTRLSRRANPGRNHKRWRGLAPLRRPSSPDPVSGVRTTDQLSHHRLKSWAAVSARLRPRASSPNATSPRGTSVPGSGTEVM